MKLSPKIVAPSSAFRGYACGECGKVARAGDEILVATTRDRHGYASYFIWHGACVKELAQGLTGKSAKVVTKKEREAAIKAEFDALRKALMKEYS